MLQSNQILQIAQLLFDSHEVARQATPILKAILDGGSAQVSEIAQQMRSELQAHSTLGSVPVNGESPI